MVNKRKLRDLEGLVLPDLPEEPQLYIQNEQEVALTKRASKIRDGLDCDLEKLYGSKHPLAERRKYAEKIMASISESDLAVLTADYTFNKIRMRDLIFNFYKQSFPKSAHGDLSNRVLWFLIEMDHLGYASVIEDNEWNFNRNEGDPDFDDYKWWGRVEALIKKDYPDGIFTEVTFKKLESWIDNKLSEEIGKYYREHPEEHKKLLESLKCD